MISLSFALLATAIGSSPPDTVRLATPSCRSCRITLHIVQTIAPDSLQGSLNGMTVARSAGGDVFAADVDVASTAVVRIGRDGRESVVLRPGPGPGEIRGVSSLVLGPADSVFVYDGRGGKLVVLAPDGAYVRETRLPIGVLGATLRRDGSSVLVVRNNSARFAGHPLVLMQRDGRLREAWSETRVFQDPRSPMWMVRRLTSPNDGTTWVQMLAYEPVVQVRAIDGSERHVLRRVSELLPSFPPGPLRTLTRDRPPVPIGLGVGVVNDSLVAVLWRVPDADWRRGLGADVRTETGEPAAIVGDRDKLFDTLVDLVDRRSYRLVASARLDQLYHGVTAGGLLVRNLEDRSEPATELVSLRIVQP